MTRAPLTILLLVLVPHASPAAAQDARAPLVLPPVAAAAPSAGTESAPATTVRFVWKEHPSLRVGKALRVDFRARVQADTRRSDAPIEEGDSSFDIARRRIGVEGEIGRFADFQVERELNDDDPWRDVYLNVRQFTAIQVQGGKFKLPFSLDETTSATNLDFVYRSRIATQLAPGRDRGVMVHGRLFKRTFEYEAGVFEHDGNNARTAAGDRVFGDRTVAVRLVAEPFRPTKGALEDFHVGVAFTTSDVPEGVTGLRGRTAFDQSFFPSRVYVSGTRRRTGIEFRVRPGPASIKAEYVRATDERRGMSVEDTDLSRFLAKGWYVSGSYAITGDPKSKGLDEPRRPLFQGGVGAIEVAARVEQLEFGSDGGVGTPSTSPRSDNIQGNRDRASTVGLNWYLNRWVKLQFNVIRERFDDVDRSPLPGVASFWSRVFRLQLVV
jgi:phosphate-selective porin OprO and OprP